MTSQSERARSNGDRATNDLTQGDPDQAAAAALACDLPAEAFARRAMDTTQLFDESRSRRALADGAELEFAGDDEVARALLDFVLAERRCCASLSYELAFVPDHSSVRLTLRGRGRQAEAIRAWAGAQPASPER